MIINKNVPENYERMITKLISTSFPDLTKKRIILRETNVNTGSADTKRFPFFLRIRVDSSLRGINDKMLIGIFSHELSHLEFFTKMSLLNFYLIRDFKLWFKKYRKYEEDVADILSIKRGYARQLYSQRKSRWSSNEKKVLDNKWKYLSPSEIKNIAKELGKWRK